MSIIIPTPVSYGILNPTITEFTSYRIPYHTSSTPYISWRTIPCSYQHF